MKSAEESMEILEAFDLTRSHQAAARLTGCSHHTVARYVARRNAGRLRDGTQPPRPSKVDRYRPKITEWVERSRGNVRADVCYRKLLGLGYEGSERTVRRAVAGAKREYRKAGRRVYRPSDHRARDVGPVGLGRGSGS